MEVAEVKMISSSSLHWANESERDVACHERGAHDEIATHVESSPLEKPISVRHSASPELYEKVV